MLGTFEEMWHDMEAGVFDYTVDGCCSNCGSCCSNLLPISTEEILRIKLYIKRHQIAEQVCNYPTAEPVFNFVCPFRDTVEKKCLIYQVRPAICRDFKCDKPRNKILADKKIYHEQNRPVDMRAEFYGRQSVFEALHQDLMECLKNINQK